MFQKLWEEGMARDMISSTEGTKKGRMWVVVLAPPTFVV